MGHYDVIGNCGQDYEDMDTLIRRDQPDLQPYLIPREVEYGFPAAAAPAARCGVSSDLIDTNQADNDHVYVSPGKPTAVTP